MHLYVLQIVFRSTNLKNLFSMPAHSAASTTITKASISKYISEDCAHSHIVFVDGAFHAQLSDISSVPTSVTVASLSQLLSASKRDTAQEALDSFLYVPDVNEVKRDSFGSDILSGLTLVNHLDSNILTCTHV